MLDVKSSERNLPLFFGSIAGFSALPSINAHARVSLEAATSAAASLPLAIPDIHPSTVFVTLWNMSDAANPDPHTYALSDLGADSTKTYAGESLEKWGNASI